MYKFVKDYKRNDSLRESFINLAKSTFGIDFTDWYEKGFWSADYIPYSYLDDEVIISNASFSYMDVIFDGIKHKIIQFGTVMTSIEYRNKGLAYNLIKKVIEDNKDIKLFFLAADEDAISLYERCGFKKSPTYNYIYKQEENNSDRKSFENVILPEKEFYDLKTYSLPISNKLCAVGDYFVHMFKYDQLNYSKKVYKFGNDIYAIMELSENEVEIYGFFSPNDLDISKILEEYEFSNRLIKLKFTPNSMEHYQIEELFDGWMVLENGLSFPKYASFPEISKT
jgi:GNAT superfamily N-acetyltransferase